MNLIAACVECLANLEGIVLTIVTNYLKHFIIYYHHVFDEGSEWPLNGQGTLTQVLE